MVNAGKFVWILLIGCWMISTEIQAQHPFSRCDKSTTTKGKARLGQYIQKWEVNQGSRWSMCEIAWIGRRPNQQNSWLIISDLAGEVLDTVALPKGIEQHKVLAIGKAQFLFIYPHLQEPLLSTRKLEKTDAGWEWSSAKSTPIPAELSGIQPYLNQAAVQTQKSVKGQVQQYMFRPEQVFFANGHVFVLMGKSEISASSEVPKKETQQWFMFKFLWSQALGNLVYKQTAQLYLPETALLGEHCGGWQYQPAAAIKNEKKVILKQGAMLPVWFNTDNMTIEPAISLKKREHHFVVTTTLLANELNCLAWKVGSTFVPGLDNKAVKSDKPVVVGIETMRIREGYMADKPRAVAQDDLIDAVFLAEGEKGNLWMMPAGNWCKNSAGGIGIFDFKAPILVYCQ
jgi:hypothetical protein